MTGTIVEISAMLVPKDLITDDDFWFEGKASSEFERFRYQGREEAIL
jgi:hypothetical protein